MVRVGRGDLSRFNPEIRGRGGDLRGFDGGGGDDVRETDRDVTSDVSDVEVHDA